MPLNIRSDEVNALAEKLARQRGVTKTEAVRQALEETLRKEEARVPLAERLRPLQDYVASLPNTGPKADKAFYDWLSGDE